MKKKTLTQERETCRLFYRATLFACSILLAREEKFDRKARRDARRLVGFEIEKKKTKKQKVKKEKVNIPRANSCRLF